MLKRLLLLCACLLSLCAHAAPTQVAAAADLKFAMDDIVQAYQKQTGDAVTVVYGSSGNFYRQIGQGAPFQVFMSADEGYVASLAKDGKTENQGDLYAIGRIVLFVPNGANIAVTPELGDVKQALTDGRINKFSIANPEHAPYGRVAREALQALGWWDLVSPKLVLGENVAQAAQFVASGSAQAGIFSLSLAVSPAFARAGKYVTLPTSLHSPLRQRMVLLKGADEPAKRFYAFVRSPAARAIFEKYGFTLPGE